MEKKTNTKQTVEVTFKFDEIKPIKVPFEKGIKIIELEQFLLSKFRIKIDDRIKEKLFGLDYRAKQNDIQETTIQINMNNLIQLLFNTPESIDLMPLVPFIPNTHIQIDESDLNNPQGSYGILKKCKFLSAKDKDDLEYAFKSFNLNNDKALESFSKEVEAYSKLNHPAIPKFLGVSYDLTHGHGILMEYIRGEHLIELIENEKKNHSILEENEKLQYVYQLADVISYLHSNKIIHRDLKPNNIMIKKKTLNDARPQLFLIDYGLSKVEDGDLNNTLATVVRRNTNVYKKLQGGDNLEEFNSFDIWSLGCIIYYLFTRKHPCNQVEKELFEHFNKGTNFFKQDEFKDEFIYEIIKDCCALDHTKRKTAEQIKEKVFLKIHNNVNNGKICL